MIGAPPARLAPLGAPERAAVLAAIEAAAGADGGPADAPPWLAWVEKLRRFASYHGRRLGPVARERFGADAPAHLEWMAAALLAGADRHPARGAAPSDAATLSGALYALDALGSGAGAAPGREAGRRVEALSRWLLETDGQPAAEPALGVPFEYRPGLWASEAPAARGVVVVSPSRASLLTLVVLDLLARLEVPVAAVVLRRFTPGRFVEEWRRDGPRLLRKIWRKLVLRADENAAVTRVSLRGLYRALGVRDTDVRRAAERLGARTILVDRLDEAVPALAPLAPRVAVFTGGGLVGQGFIDAFDLGVINGHLGLLPGYKGMDVVQAPLVEGRFDAVGITCHLMALGLDAGDVLGAFRTDASGYDDLASLRNELSAVAPLVLVDAMLGLSSGRLRRIVQPEAGRQFYFLHPRLLGPLDAALASRAGEAVDAERAVRDCLADPTVVAGPAARS